MLWSHDKPLKHPWTTSNELGHLRAIAMRSRRVWTPSLLQLLLLTS